MVVAAVIGSTTAPVDAAEPVVEPRVRVDEIALSVTGAGAVAGSLDVAGPLRSGDIDVTDADLDTEAKSIRVPGAVDAAAGPVAVEFDLQRVLGISSVLERHRHGRNTRRTARGIDVLRRPSRREGDT